MSGQAGRARTFVAVWPDDATIAALRSFERPDIAGVRWTTGDQWHVTLRFLGTLDGDESSALERILGSVARRHRSLTATLGPSSTVLGRNVLVAPVAGLDDLALSVTLATGRLGRPPDHDAFVGHLTLARRRRGRARLDALGGLPVSATFPVSELAVVQSRMTPAGARYTTAARVPLTG
ncbi:MAG TPA: RNA 2',3'-cyclic phosphodiesterase [Acidimicrobiales bacterium]